MRIVRFRQTKYSISIVLDLYIMSFVIHKNANCEQQSNGIQYIKTYVSLTIEICIGIEVIPTMLDLWYFKNFK